MRTGFSSSDAQVDGARHLLMGRLPAAPARRPFSELLQQGAVGMLMPYRSPSSADWDLPPPVKPDSRVRLPLVLGAVASIALGLFGFAAFTYGLEREQRKQPHVLTAAEADPGIFYGADGIVYVDTAWSYLHASGGDGQPLAQARVLVATGSAYTVRLP